MNEKRKGAISMKRSSFSFSLLFAVLFFMACEDSGTGYSKYADIYDVPDCNANRANEHVYVMTEGEYEERVCKYEKGHYEWGYPDSVADTETDQEQKKSDCQCWSYYLVNGKEGLGRIYIEIDPGVVAGADKYYVCGEEDIKGFINQRPVIKSYMHNEDRCW